ncbi:polyprenyl synthetase family protein [Streptomyces parvus]|uniref:polyprenyl synthetase family protein n=1 Tax=Streptomyces TaxID=1883 RepID=UPI00094A858D|nr:polyprenyl synthetase family protein [Streptomyces sp. Tue 6075]APS20102.1 polyprenyl synthetase [Streptomyces sp. Tue 6075]
MTNSVDAVTRQMQERIENYQRRFGVLFQDYFKRLRQEFDAPKLSRFTPRSFDLLEDLSLRGGKRQRVAFMYEAARLVTSEPVPGIDEAALSIELLQTHLLVHDDIIDDAPTRRGGTSTYYSYKEEFPEQPQTALGLALLAGDLAAFLSLRVLLEADLPLSLRQALVETQVTAGAATFVGQMYDLERDLPALPTEEMLHEVSDYKASRSSALAPIQLGLLAAGEDVKQFDATLRRYALMFGISGQMCDDYLSLFGDEKVTGKPATADVRDGRRTYAIRAILAAADASERGRVESILGRQDASADDIDTIREIARRHGVDQQLRSQMHRYAEEACVEAASWRPRWRDEAVTFFERIPVWGVERTL